MTTATVAAPQGNQFAVLLAIFLVITFTTCVALWVHERRMDRNEDELYAHAEQLAGLDYQMQSLLEYLGVEIPEPVGDDSPEGLATVDDDAPTEEFDAIPETVPDGMPLAVQTALIKTRSADWVEQELARVRARIDAAREAS